MLLTLTISLSHTHFPVSKGNQQIQTARSSKLRCLFLRSDGALFICLMFIYLHTSLLASSLQDGLQDEMSSYADEVFETPSEAALKELDERELTGSALDKNELERSHLMLWVHICTCERRLTCVSLQIRFLDIIC